MAENKKSFILYADQAGLFDKLPDVKAGKLIKLIFDYVNDKNPSPTDILLQVAFEPIKVQLKRDLLIWEAERSKRALAGKKGGIKSGESRRSRSKRSSASKNEANEADNVNVNDTVNVIESVGDTHNLSESNLFRKPVIPTFEKVHEVFLNNGGTEEMAKKFYETNDSTGWYIRGSPIKNFSSLVPGYVQAWKNNSVKQNKPELSGPPLTRI